MELIREFEELCEMSDTASNEVLECSLPVPVFDSQCTPASENR